MGVRIAVLVGVLMAACGSSDDGAAFAGRSAGGSGAITEGCDPADRAGNYDVELTRESGSSQCGIGERVTLSLAEFQAPNLGACVLRDSEWSEDACNLNATYECPHPEGVWTYRFFVRSKSNKDGSLVTGEMVITSLQTADPSVQSCAASYSFVATK